MSYTVYSILEDGKTVYVGMTNNMQRRKREQRYKRKLDGDIPSIRLLME